MIVVDLETAAMTEVVLKTKESDDNGRESERLWKKTGRLYSRRVQKVAQRGEGSNSLHLDCGLHTVKVRFRYRIHGPISGQHGCKPSLTVGPVFT